MNLVGNIAGVYSDNMTESQCHSPTAGLSIRRFDSEDLPEVFALHVMAMKSIGAYAGSRWDQDFNDIPGIYGNEFYVGELSGKIVAMGALRRESETTAELRRMRVHPEFQRHGFGKLLLAKLESRAAELGYSRLYLDTYFFLKDTQAFIRKSGYVQTHNCSKTGWELFFFEKKLEQGD